MRVSTSSTTALVIAATLLGAVHSNSVFTVNVNQVKASGDFAPFPVENARTARAMLVRGGASKPRSKSRVASLASSSKKRSSSSAKTASGKRKVGSTDVSSKAKEPSSFRDSMNKYKSILPMTRVYITLVGAATLLGLILGEEMTQALLALDPIRVFQGLELWRPLTAATFLGPPSIGWLMNGYYLFEYGSTLERAYGTAQHFVFLVSQVCLLSILSVLVGQPFFAPSMITSMLHVLSRAMPHQKVKWLVFTVPYWSLPYGLMATDVLQAQSAAAALPHIMGILSGHFYQFHKFIWPKMGGEDWLVPWNFLQRRLDPNYKSSDGESQSRSTRARTIKGRKIGS